MKLLPPAYRPTIADLDYPKHIRTAIDAFEEAWSAWNDADVAIDEAEAALEAAELADAQALKNAALQGKALPKPRDTRELERAVIAAKTVEPARRSESDRLANALEALMREHRITIFNLAIDKALAGVDEYNTRIAATMAEQDAARMSRRAALDGLAMAAELASPDLYIQRGFADPDLPRVRIGEDAEVANVVMMLRTLSD